ncbi:ribosome recycling factor [Thermospira aquatica]|uniref:Ribosome-recycling factor n=1 Tax=Thermospira aquatica TaxID=2828656 RepID=A0AAX3BCP1_9SPIR|nr:ribosome recycling factor [Thermospira aquatica]URA09964.1 ribosome recycling factor [Thermospira aquatica]
MVEAFEKFKKEAKDRMDKALSHFMEELKHVKTGRASIGMVEDIRFDYYGTPTPIRQAASLNTPDPHTIVIDAWDKSILKNIEKGINDANLGFTVVNDGKVLRVAIPPLTEDSKKALVKKIKEMGEEIKVTIRNERRDINNHIKELVKGGHISEDDERRELDAIQKITDDHIKHIDELVEKKAKEIMEF